MHHSGSWDLSLDKHLGGVGLRRRGNDTTHLLLATGDLESFFEADDRHRGYGDGTEMAPLGIGNLRAFAIFYANKSGTK